MSTLGRPWQYDKEAVHHGKENKYSFKKDGVTYRIKPMVKEDKVEKATTKTLFMSGKEFLKELKEGEGEGYTIMVKPKEENSLTQQTIPTKVQELLD